MCLHFRFYVYMKNPKYKVLFLLNGNGFGNAARIMALIQNMNTSEIQIDIGTSKSVRNFFDSYKLEYNFKSLHFINYPGKNGSINVFKLPLLIPFFLIAAVFIKIWFF